MTLAHKIQKVEFVIFVILMQELVEPCYIIISAAPKKAAYHIQNIFFRIYNLTL